MKEKFMRFMQGRYGVDQFSRFLMGVGIALIVLSIFFKNQIISLLVFGILIYVYYRMFSRDISKRYGENQKFLTKTASVRGIFAKEKNRMIQRKIYRFYKCPSCSQEVRVPKGKGKIEISCPKCQTKFMKRS